MIKNKYIENGSTLTLAAEKCIGCGMCINVCPHEVFALTVGKAAIINRDSCMECGACMKNCPVGVIMVKTGVGCAAALINEMLTGEKTCDCSNGNC